MVIALFLFGSKCLLRKSQILLTLLNFKIIIFPGNICYQRTKMLTISLSISQFSQFQTERSDAKHRE